MPSAYYQELEARVGKINEPVDTLAELGVLVDRDELTSVADALFAIG